MYLLKDPVWFSDSLDVGCEKKKGVQNYSKMFVWALKKYGIRKWRWSGLNENRFIWGAYQESNFWEVNFTCQLNVEWGV